MQNTYLKDTTNINSLNSELNYVIIHPNETKFFSYYQTLPSYRDEFPQYHGYYLNSNDKYTFEMVVKNDAKKIEKYFSENLKREIQENNYTIFDGELKSNKVPISFIKKH